MEVRRINLIKMVAKLLENNVDSKVIMQALKYGGLPDDLIDTCLELTMKQEIERLMKLCREVIDQIKYDIKRLMRKIDH